MTKIEWTDETWNPIIGCTKVSPGCDNCYAEKMANRLAAIAIKGTNEDLGFDISGIGNYALIINNGKWNGKTRLVRKALLKPAQWKKPRMIFVCSMGDLFHESIPFEHIDAVFSVMSDIDQHIYQILTKRPWRMLEFYVWKEKQSGIPWQAKDNVWPGVTIENQEQITRIFPLLKVPAKIHFISCEPLLSYIDLYPWLDEYIGPSKTDHNDWLNGINWVIAGGESGPKARPMHPDWVRSLRNQCNDNNVPFFFKQWGEFYPEKRADMNGPFMLHHGMKVRDWYHLRFDGKFGLYDDYKSEWNGENDYWMAKVGKKQSGNELDFEKHENFPVITK